jgi:hypothetical protein
MILKITARVALFSITSIAVQSTTMFPFLVVTNTSDCCSIVVMVMLVISGLDILFSIPFTCWSTKEIERESSSSDKVIVVSICAVRGDL